MSNIIHVDFSNNNRTVLTPSQRLTCKQAVLPFRPNKALEDERYEIMDKLQRAKEIRDYQFKTLIEALTYKQFNASNRAYGYISRSKLIKKISKSRKIHDMADGVITAQEWLAQLNTEYIQITDKLEALGHWGKAQ